MNATLEPAECVQQLVAFHLANETYGVDISLINEIIRVPEITRIPRTGEDVEGVINLRGKIVPIIDLRKRLDLPEVERTGVTRIIVLELTGTIVGVVVDSVTGVLRIPSAEIEAPSELVSDVEFEYIRGVGKSDNALVILLNMHKALGIGE